MQPDDVCTEGSRPRPTTASGTWAAFGTSAHVQAFTCNFVSTRCRIMRTPNSVELWLRRDPLMCAQGHLGLHLAHHYTCRSNPFPDPRNKERWNNAPLWPAGRTEQNVSYNAYRDGLRCVLALVLFTFTPACVYVSGLW